MVMSCETNKGRVDNYRGGKKAKAGSNNKLKMKRKINQEANGGIHPICKNNYKVLAQNERNI